MIKTTKEMKDKAFMDSMIKIMETETKEIKDKAFMDSMIENKTKEIEEIRDNIDKQRTDLFKHSMDEMFKILENRNIFNDIINEATSPNDLINSSNDDYDELVKDIALDIITGKIALPKSKKGDIKWLKQQWISELKN